MKENHKVKLKKYKEKIKALKRELRILLKSNHISKEALKRTEHFVDEVVQVNDQLVHTLAAATGGGGGTRVGSHNDMVNYIISERPLLRPPPKTSHSRTLSRDLPPELVAHTRDGSLSLDCWSAAGEHIHNQLLNESNVMSDQFNRRVNVSSMERPGRH